MFETGQTTRRPGSIVLRVNRSSELFVTAASRIIADYSNPDGNVLFVYWDEFTQRLELDDCDAFCRVIKPIARKIYNPIATKSWIAKRCSELGIESLFPRTFMTIDAALPHRDVGVWFVKNSHGTAGKGMHCLTPEQLPNASLPPHHILQEGIDNPLLYEGRKFTARFYLLVWDGHAHLFDDGFIVVHGVPYIRGSTDYDVQINHAGYHRAGSPIRMRQLSEHQPAYERFPKLKEAATRLLPVLDDTIQAADRDTFLLVGVDALLLDDGSVRLLEVNAMPNFIHSPDINRALNVPFFEAVMRRILGQPSPRLTSLESD